MKKLQCTPVYYDGVESTAQYSLLISTFKKATLLLASGVLDKYFYATHTTFLEGNGTFTWVCFFMVALVAHLVKWVHVCGNEPGSNPVCGVSFSPMFKCLCSMFHWYSLDNWIVWYAAIVLTGMLVKDNFLNCAIFIKVNLLHLKHTIIVPWAHLKYTWNASAMQFKVTKSKA